MQAPRSRNALFNAIVDETRAAVPDRDLLERFVSAHDESAFATLVGRYGGMVLQLCRRLLRNPDDAEDAFQGTFLVLALKAAYLDPRESLVGWLYQVAYRTAQKVRIAAARRRRHERSVCAGSTADALDELSLREAYELLDRELLRLPDRLRVPLVMCYLEGLTRDEAARRLGWAPCLVKSRLEQGRERLARRLASRGFTLSGALVVTLLSNGSAPGAVPGLLLDTTVRAASTLAAGGTIASVVSGRVAEVTQGVIRSMSTIKSKIAMGLLLMVIGLGAAAGLARENPTAYMAQTKVQPESGPGEGPALPVVLAPLPETTSARAEKPEPLTLNGYTYDVVSVCFSPDGKRIVTGGGKLAISATAPGEMKVWDAEKGIEILALKGHTDKVCGVCYSPDGKRIASTSNDGTVMVWDAQKGKVVLTLPGQARLGSLCFSPDSKRIASICSGNPFLTVKVWDAEKGQELLTLQGQAKANCGICFSSDGKRIASEGGKGLGEIKIWDAEKGQELLTIKAAQKVACVAFSPDGKRLASNGVDQTVRVWDAQNGQELLTLKGHTGNVSSVCFSPDGKRLASASFSPDQTVKVWDAEKGKELLTLKGHTGAVRSVCFSPDGKHLASASNDKTVKVWSLDEKK